MSRKPPTKVMDFADKIQANMAEKKIAVTGLTSAAMLAQGLQIGETYLDSKTEELRVVCEDGTYPIAGFASAPIGAWPTTVEIGNLHDFQPLIGEHHRQPVPGFKPNMEEFVVSAKAVVRPITYVYGSEQALIGEHPQSEPWTPIRRFVPDQDHGSFPRLLGHLISLILPEVKATFEPLKEFFRYQKQGFWIDNERVVEGENYTFDTTASFTIYHAAGLSHYGDGAPLKRSELKVSVALSNRTRQLIMPRQIGKTSFLQKLKDHYK